MSIEERFAEAKARHLAGDLAAARELYHGILAIAPSNHEVTFRLGILALQTGQTDEALVWVGLARQQHPAEPRYCLGEGQILATLGRYEQAARTYREALAHAPASIDAWFALASVLEASGDRAGAIGAYAALLELDAFHADTLNNLGNCYRQQGDVVQAEEAYRRALAAQPAHASALANLATLLQTRGHLDEAVALLREAVVAEPGVAAHRVNLGVALAEQREHAEATAVLEQARALDPQHADAAYNLASVLHAQGRREEARAHYLSAIALAPAHADAHNNLGNLLKELGDHEAAAAAFESAIRARPGFVAAYNNAGSLARALGRMDDAEARYRAALAADPRHSASWNNLGNVLKDTGALDEALDCYRRALDCDPHNVVAHSNLAYGLTFQTEDGYAVLDECKRFAARHEAPLLAGAPSHANRRDPHKRLRVGYVSADFRDHCQSLFTAPLFAHHDHEAFEIVCYSSVVRPDTFTQRIAGWADVWRDVRTLDDAQLAQTVRDDGIDILVDLTMHMADGRPLLFARQPAPVQVAWLAYPGTTGSRAIGYRLTDPWLDPAGDPHVDSQYSERSVRLPDSFWCYDPHSSVPPVEPSPQRPGEQFTFGCLNNPCKLTDRTLGMWPPVMRAVPEARLVLMAPSGRVRERLAARLAAHGIDMRRVVFRAFRPREQYLETYREIDLALDTFPYNGHTTSLDALWMGVPVVTRVGRSVVGRGGLSQLANLGLTELAASTDEQFVRLAVELAHDTPRLATLRASLRPRMTQSPLMDGARFAANVERAYRQMWTQWCA